MRKIHKKKPDKVAIRESLFFDRDYNDVSNIDKAEVEIVRDLDSKGMVMKESEFLLRKSK